MAEIRILPARKRIALVAHDNKKADLMAWAKSHREVLTNHDLLATGTTGKLLEKELEVPVKKLLSGPLGGDQQIGALIAIGEIDLLIFFWDPMEAQPHDSDVKALLRISNTWNIPCASNRSAADFLLSSPLLNDTYEVQVPDYTTYLRRSIQQPTTGL